MASESWAVGDAYEPYIGRWSRAVAAEFVAWLDAPKGSRWLDVGCGTGALTAAILERAEPRDVTAIDPSEGFLDYARAHVDTARATFVVGDAHSLPLEDGTVDVAVAGLVINFFADAHRGLVEMARTARPAGTVAAYVWDYAEGMELIRRFWDAARDLDPAAAALDEGERFPLCRPAPLERLFLEAGLAEVEVRAIDVPTPFRDFDDYWTPFLGAQGPAPGYAMSLDEPRREALRERLRASLPASADGSIALTARAWAVRSLRP